MNLATLLRWLHCQSRRRVMLVDHAGPMRVGEFLAAVREATPSGRTSLHCVPSDHGRSTLIQSFAAAAAGHDVVIVEAGASAPPQILPATGRVWLGTTGTTGARHHSARSKYDLGLLRPVLQLWRQWRLHRSEPILVQPPLHHGYGFGMSLMALLSRSPLLLPADRTHCDELIMAYRPALTVSVPTQLNRLNRVPGWNPRVMITGSGPLSPELSQRVRDTFGPVLYNLFGSTEAGFATMATPADLHRAPGCVGRALAGVRIRLSTPQSLVEVSSPFATQPGTWIPTGDRGRLDDHGLLHLLGRVDGVVIVHGRNVVPEAVTAALMTHPAVQHARTVALADPIAGHRLHVHVLVAPTARDTVPLKNSLQDWVRERTGATVTAWHIASTETELPSLGHD